jgi:hypothetical protein
VAFQKPTALILFFFVPFLQFQMSSSNETPAIVGLPPNQSLLLMDSRFRNPDDTPYNFSSFLTSALVAKEVYYKTLAWSQPFFTHNLLNNEIRFKLANDDAGDVTYVAYVKPWTIFKEYDGNPPPAFFAPPVNGSYAADVTDALADARVITNNMVPANPTVNSGHTVTPSFLFSPSKGFVMFFTDDTTSLITPFLLLDSNWIARAHYVHGFGVYDTETEQFLAPDTNGAFQNAYSSDAAPTLIYTRYVLIHSKELNRERRLISFSTANSDAFINELGVMSTSVQKSGEYHQSTVTTDSTVVSLREGTEPQYIRITILDEYGRDILVGNPIQSFLQNPDMPPDVIAAYFDSAQNFRSTEMINFFQFGQSTSFATNHFNEYFQGSLSSRTNAAPGTSTSISLFYNTAGSVDDTECPIHIRLGTPRSAFFDPSSTNYWTAEVVVSYSSVSAAATGTQQFFIELIKTDSLSVTTVLDTYSSPVLATGLTVGPTTYTATFAGPFAVSLSDTVRIRWYLTTVGNTQPVTADLTPDTFTDVTFTSFFTAANPGYFDPTTNDLFGNPAIVALPDDLVHQLEIVSQY